MAIKKLRLIYTLVSVACSSKRVIGLSVSEMIESGIPVRVDDPRGGEFLTGEELYEITTMLEKNPTKQELFDLIQKIVPTRN